MHQVAGFGRGSADHEDLERLLVDWEREGSRTGSSGTFGSQGTCWVTRSMVAKAVATMGRASRKEAVARAKSSAHAQAHLCKNHGRHGSAW